MIYCTELSSTDTFANTTPRVTQYVEVLGYSFLLANIYADQEMTLVMNFSSDSTNIDHTEIVVSQPNKIAHMNIPLRYRYVRFSYSPDAIPNTIMQLNSFLNN